MADLSGMELLTHDEFWARDPAPGTVFFELGATAMQLVGCEIEPGSEDPDNAVLVQLKRASGDEPELYAVMSWGSWDAPENRKIRELQLKARAMMAKDKS